MSETRVRRGTAVVAAVDEQRDVPCPAPFRYYASVLGGGLYWLGGVPSCELASEGTTVCNRVVYFRAGQ